MEIMAMLLGVMVAPFVVIAKAIAEIFQLLLGRV
jgi:hypothetical protein